MADKFSMCLTIGVFYGVSTDVDQKFMLWEAMSKGPCEVEEKVENSLDWVPDVLTVKCFFELIHFGNEIPAADNFSSPLDILDVTDCEAIEEIHQN